jgi:hypothetical protein
MMEGTIVRKSLPAQRQSYINVIANVSHSPTGWGMRACQLWLIARQRSWSYVSQTVCAWRCLYSVTLSRSDVHGHIVAALAQRLPVARKVWHPIRAFTRGPAARHQINAPGIDPVHRLARQRAGATGGWIRSSPRASTLRSRTQDRRAGVRCCGARTPSWLRAARHRAWSAGLLRTKWWTGKEL